MTGTNYWKDTVKPIIYSEIKGNSTRFYTLAAIFAIFIVAALACAYYMEHYGHYVTGMTNQVVWGTPHVFAIFLIVAASGALNVASIGSVFGKTIYKPLGRLSGLLALALLVGGLVVLVLDLGRPDRLIVAMTHYNFKSIFAWNIFLYVGFMVIVAAYLWLQMERRLNQHAKTAGMVAFIWRLVLTTGTGSIFGFLIAREAYDAAIMAPLFVAMSFSFGLAVYILTLLAACRGSGRDIGDTVIYKLSRLLGIFAAAVLYFTAVQHLANLYAAEHIGVERFILLDGGLYTFLFWAGQVVVGGIIPMVLVFRPAGPRLHRNTIMASTLVIIGGFAQVYVIVIGGQAYPLDLFPGMEVSSSFNDGVISSYTPSLPEIGLGLGGVALACLIVLFGIKLLRFLPVSMANAVIDPHYKT
uniref:Sulfur oxidation protein DsrP n=1 Tax=uncultured bacterium ws085G8 TaxID=1131825 RepID=I1X5B4_9BACT|nr:sulfur oxidation protein DsrP [uncultured bacterium ws085G8]